MWQAEDDKELTLSASPATAVGQIQLTMAKFSELHLLALDSWIQLILQNLKVLKGVREMEFH